MIAEHVNHFSLAQAMCTVKTKVLLLLSLAAVASVTKTAGDGFECITVDRVDAHPAHAHKERGRGRGHSHTPQLGSAAHASLHCARLFGSGSVLASAIAYGFL